MLLYIFAVDRLKAVHEGALGAAQEGSGYSTPRAMSAQLPPLKGDGAPQSAARPARQMPVFPPLRRHRCPWKEAPATVTPGPPGSPFRQHQGQETPLNDGRRHRRISRGGQHCRAGEAVGGPCEGGRALERRSRGQRCRRGA